MLSLDRIEKRGALFASPAMPYLHVFAPSGKLAPVNHHADDKENNNNCSAQARNTQQDRHGGSFPHPESYSFVLHRLMVAQLW
jgi:hypothetical protein